MATIEGIADQLIAMQLFAGVNAACGQLFGEKG